MQLHHFYAKYSNVKIPARSEPIEVTPEVRQFYPSTLESLTLSDIYNEIDQLENIMRPLRLQQEYLMDMATKKLWENQA